MGGGWGVRASGVVLEAVEESDSSFGDGTSVCRDVAGKSGGHARIGPHTPHWEPNAARYIVKQNMLKKCLIASKSRKKKRCFYKCFVSLSVTLQRG